MRSEPRCALCGPRGAGALWAQKKGLRRGQGLGAPICLAAACTSATAAARRTVARPRASAPGTGWPRGAARPRSPGDPGPRPGLPLLATGCVSAAPAGPCRWSQAKRRRAAWSPISLLEHCGPTHHPLSTFSGCMVWESGCFPFHFLLSSASVGMALLLQYHGLQNSVPSLCLLESFGVWAAE